jgi:hypothetical protein
MRIAACDERNAAGARRHFAQFLADWLACLNAAFSTSAPTIPLHPGVPRVARLSRRGGRIGQKGFDAGRGKRARHPQPDGKAIPEERTNRCPAF